MLIETEILDVQDCCWLDLQHDLGVDLKIEHVNMARALNEVDHGEVTHPTGEVRAREDGLASGQAELKPTHGRDEALSSFLPVASLRVRANGRVVEANPAACELLEREPERLVGRSLSELLSREDVTVFQDHCQSVIHNGQRRHCDLEIQRRNGRPIHVRLVSIAAAGPAGEPPELRSMLIDLQDDWEAQQRCSEECKHLRQSKERFQAIAERLGEVFYVVEATGVTSYASAAYESVWGRKLSDLFDRPVAWLEAIHPDDRERVDAAIANTRRGDPLDMEYRIRRPDGAIRWIHDRSFPVEDAGSLVRSIGAAQDITAEKELQDELRQALKMEAIGTLASGVAHDFNNVLQGIAGLAGIACATSTSPERARAAAGHIKDMALRSGGLAKQLITFVRKQPASADWVSLDGIIRDAVPILRRLLGEAIRLNLDLAAPKSTLQADPMQIEQVLMNLAANARDAMPEGGTLALRTAEVATEDLPTSAQGLVQGSGTFLRLEVRDSGHGMDDNTRQQIFEPFFTTKDVGQGTGLGLAMVFVAVRQLGGYIHVDSAVSRGSTFTLYLPCSRRPAVSPQRPAEKATKLEGSVLVVEDEPLVRLMLRSYLEGLGLEVFDAAEPAMALAFCETRTEGIDLLVSDVTLPGMAGPQMAELLGEHYDGLPVVFVSAHSRETLVERDLLSRDAAFLQKPFDEEQLGTVVADVLRGRHPHNGMP